VGVRSDEAEATGGVWSSPLSEAFSDDESDEDESGNCIVGVDAER
jgi:hypothetical protein